MMHLKKYFLTSSLHYKKENKLKSLRHSNKIFHALKMHQMSLTWYNNTP